MLKENSIFPRTQSIKNAKIVYKFQDSYLEDYTKMIAYRPDPTIPGDYVLILVILGF